MTVLLTRARIVVAWRESTGTHVQSIPSFSLERKRHSRTRQTSRVSSFSADGDPRTLTLQNFPVVQTRPSTSDVVRCPSSFALMRGPGTDRRSLVSRSGLVIQWPLKMRSAQCTGASFEQQAISDSSSSAATRWTLRGDLCTATTVAPAKSANSENALKNRDDSLLP